MPKACAFAGLDRSVCGLWERNHFHVPVRTGCSEGTTPLHEVKTVPQGRAERQALKSRSGRVFVPRSFASEPDGEAGGGEAGGGDGAGEEGLE
jgi:hypothetical protein